MLLCIGRSEFSLFPMSVMAYGEEMNIREKCISHKRFLTIL